MATECNQLAEDVVRLSQRAQSLQKDMANFCSSLDEKSRLDFSDEEFLKRWSFAFILLRTELAACATVAQHERKTSEAIDKSLYDAVTAACLIERFNTSVFLRSTAGKH